jgi:hypothetical protein
MSVAVVTGRAREPPRARSRARIETLGIQFLEEGEQLLREGYGTNYERPGR